MTHRVSSEQNPGADPSRQDARFQQRLAALATRLDGELLVDDTTRTIYATDASEYQERPLAVALPRTDADVGAIVRFAAAEGVGIIPRGAGTSLDFALALVKRLFGAATAQDVARSISA